MLLEEKFTNRIYLVLVLLFWVGMLTGCAVQGTKEPQLHFDQSVAADLRTLADEAWVQFTTVFHDRKACFGDVHLRTDSGLESRAVYDPKTATVTVQVPRTPAFLQAALIHEWAHHVEFQCDEHQLLRPRLLALLDLPADTAWRSDTEWEYTPSEHYAEAVVELVLGDHPLPTKIRVDQDMVDILQLWVAGE